MIFICQRCYDSVNVFSPVCCSVWIAACTSYAQVRGPIYLQDSYPHFRQIYRLEKAGYLSTTDTLYNKIAIVPMGCKCIKEGYAFCPRCKRIDRNEQLN